MRTRLFGGLVLGLTLSFGAIAGPAVASSAVGLPVRVPAPPAAAAPAVAAAAPAGSQACDALYTVLVTLATAGAIVPGAPIALPAVPNVGVYTLIGLVNTNLAPTIDSLCAWF